MTLCFHDNRSSMFSIRFQFVSFIFLKNVSSILRRLYTFYTLKHILTTFGIDLSNVHLWTTFEHWYKLSDVGYNSMTTVIWTSCLCCPTSYSRYLEKKMAELLFLQPLGKTPVPSWRHPSWTILEQHNKQVKRHWNILDVLSTPKIKTSLFANWTLSKNRFHSTIY